MLIIATQIQMPHEKKNSEDLHLQRHITMFNGRYKMAYNWARISGKHQDR